MKDKQLLFYEGIREKAYQLLAACYTLPNEEIVESISVLEDLLRNICAEAADLFASIQEDTTSIQALEVDFSRLFVGPFKVLAPPYGSIYLDTMGTVMGLSTVDAR